MKKISDMPACERPREKLIEKGPENLKDAELLAVILGAGYKGKNVLELAKFVLSKITKKKLLSVTYKELVKLKGINQAKATTLLSSFELAKRALKVRSETIPLIKTAKDIVAQSVYLRAKTREHLMVIFLNARNEMVFKKPMFIGTLNANLVHPREIFKEALNQNAAKIILVHNHPSGSPEPSESDLQITEQIKKAGEMMGIELLDHVIITQNKFFSFREKKLI